MAMRRFDERQYRAAIEWLKLLLAIASIIGLVGIYFLLPQALGTNPTVELLKASIPNAVVALLVIPVVYFVLTRAGVSFEQKLEKLLEDSDSAPTLRFKNDIYEAADFIADIVDKKRAQRTIMIEILGFTGATFTTALLRDLISAHPKKLSICLRRIDFSKVDNSLLPLHWPHEADETEMRLKGLSEQTAATEVWHYPSLPFLLGLQIDQSDLLIAFPVWNHDTGRIADRGNEYYYYRRHAKNEHMFHVFQNWTRQPGQWLSFSSKPTP